jgi:hypothetical protein
VDFGGLLLRIRAGRNIPILESPLVSSPVVGGIFRPMLILPSGFASSLSAGQLEWVLLHELAHVRRRDLAVKVFQCLATILHFVNPALWIANRMINRLREYACDDMASAFGNGSQVESGEAFLGVMRYAASIQHRAEVKFDGAIGLFESTARSSCFERMKRLLDTNRRVTARLGLGSFCVLLLTAILALPQIRAANEPAAEEQTPEQSAEKIFEKKNEPKPSGSAAASVAPAINQEEKKQEAKKKEEIPEAFHFSVVIAKHVMLLDGKEIVTWPQIEQIIAKRPNPSLTIPAFFTTNGAHEAGLYEPAKQEIWRLHGTYKLVGHSEGSLSYLANLRYDEIQTPADLKPDESLRIDGRVIDKNDKPVANAEVILVTPIDASISYRTHSIYLVEGRVRQPLEEVMARSNARGEFSLYPPKGKNYALIAMHPDGGIGFSGRDQLAQDEKKIHLLLDQHTDAALRRHPGDRVLAVLERPERSTADAPFRLYARPADLRDDHLAQFSGKGRRSGQCVQSSRRLRGAAGGRDAAARSWAFDRTAADVARSDAEGFQRAATRIPRTSRKRRSPKRTRTKNTE